MKRQMRMLWMVALPLALGCCGNPKDGPEPLSSATFESALSILQVQSHLGNAEARANCLEALQVSRDPRVVDMIDRGLHDREWVVRFAAAMAAGERRAGEVKPVLNTMVVHDPNLNVKVGCIYALWRLGDESHVSELGRTIADSDPGVRANTALVLGKMGESSIVLLDRYRNDPDIRVRFAITAALARLGNPSAMNVIVSESVNKYAEDQFNAMEVCADLPATLPEGIRSSPLLAGLGDGTVPRGSSRDAEYLTTARQLIAARSLAKMRYNNELAAKVAIDNQENPDPRLRALAALALGEMLSSHDAPTMDRMLKDTDETVRRAAAAAVVNIYARAARPKP
jgi:HEAT repeat protein